MNFIAWAGGACPVAPQTVVTVQLGGDATVTKTRNAEDFRWEWANNGVGGDITAYAVGAPVQTTP